MKKRALILTLVVVLLSSFAFSALADYINTDPPFGDGGTLNLRKSNSSSSTVIATISNGTSCTVHSTDSSTGMSNITAYAKGTTGENKGVWAYYSGWVKTGFIVRYAK